MSRGYISLLITALFIASCSLKEERIDCPCLFTLDLTACTFEDDVMTFSLWDAGEKVFSDLFYHRDMGQKYEFNLSRKSYLASAYSGNTNSTESGRLILTKKGNQSDSLFAWASNLDANGETSNCMVRLHKQFAVLTFDLSEYDADGTGYRIKIGSEYGGIDILTLAPVMHPFEFEFDTVGNNYYPVRIPRQGDDGLYMEIFQNGKSLGRIPIGGTLKSIGYDWSAPDLKDVCLEISDNIVSVSVGVSGWEDADSKWKL